MSNPFTVETNGGEKMSNEQARYFALSIMSGVKSYIKTHRQEYEAWIAEQSNGGGDEI